MKVNLSQTVKKLCNNQNMTLKDLANKMEIAPESLSRAINGNPQLSTLESIATHLDVNISELFSCMLGMSLFFYLCTRNHESQSRLMGVKVY